MCTEPRGKRAGAAPQDGFTLVEVLVALVILAVGLLGLEALGIGASRMVARAERESYYVSVATDTLERTLGRVRESPGSLPALPYTETGSTPGGDPLHLSIASTPVGGGLSLYTVTTTVVPRSTGAQVMKAADSVTVVGNVLR